MLVYLEVIAQRCELLYGGRLASGHENGQHVRHTIFQEGTKVAASKRLARTSEDKKQVGGGVGEREYKEDEPVERKLSRGKENQKRRGRVDGLVEKDNACCRYWEMPVSIK